MPQAETVGGIGSAFGDFMQGVLQGKAQKSQQETAERADRQARVGQLFSTAEKMRQTALSSKLQGPARDKMWGEAESIFSSAMALSAQLDDKPTKPGKKQNPFMQFLSVMNPYSDSSRPPGEFDENFSKIVSAMGPGMGAGPGAGAPGATGAAPDAAAQIAGAMAPGGAPATPGGPVGGFSSATEGQVGGMTAAPTAAVPGAAAPTAAAPGAAAPGAAPGGLPATLGAPEGAYTSPYFTPDEATVQRQKFAQLTEIYTAMRGSFEAKGIKTVEDLQKFPQGREIAQHLMFLAASDEFDGFDELEEVYAGLGLQAARSGKDQFEEDYFQLARRAAGEGEPLNDQEQLNFAEMRRLRRTGASGPEKPEEALWREILAKHGNDVTAAFAEFTKATAKEGTQGFSWRTAVNPKSGNNEIVSFNNRAGTWEFTNLKVPTGFSIDDVMTKDPDTLEERMDGSRIIYYHQQGDIDYDTLEWFLGQIPPKTENRNKEPIDNPEYLKVKEHFDRQPKPKIATIDMVKLYAKSREESYDQTRTWLEGLGYTIDEGGG